MYGMVNSAFLSKDFLLLSEEVSAASSYRTLTFTIPLRRVLPLLVTISSGSTVAVALRISPICGSFEEISCCSLSIMLPSEINCLSASLIGTFLSSIFEQVFVGALSLSDCRGVNGIRIHCGRLGFTFNNYFICACRQFKGFTPAYFSSYIYAQSDIYFPGVYKSAVNRSNF